MKHLEILSQKQHELAKILNATKQLKLTGEGDDENMEREAELFTSLYEERADVIAKIQKMDEDLAQFEDNWADDIAAQEIIAKIKETAKGIADLDKEHLVVSDKLMEFLKKNIKKIRNGRGVSSAYTDPESSSGYYFDSAN